MALLLRKMNPNVKFMGESYEKLENINSTLAENMNNICIELNRFKLTQMRRNKSLNDIFEIAKPHFLTECFLPATRFKKWRDDIFNFLEGPIMDLIANFTQFDTVGLKEAINQVPIE